MDKIKNFEDFIGDISISNSEHRLNEMTSISDPTDKLPNKVSVWVYGENDEQATKTPHFHVIGEDFEFEVYIRHIHELDIWRTKRIDKKSLAGTWDTRANIRDAIKEWLDKPNKQFEPLSNANTIVAQWNSNNVNHKIPQSWKN